MSVTIGLCTAASFNSFLTTEAPDNDTYNGYTHTGHTSQYYRYYHTHGKLGPSLSHATNFVQEWPAFLLGNLALFEGFLIHSSGGFLVLTRGNSSRFPASHLILYVLAQSFLLCRHGCTPLLLLVRTGFRKINFQFRWVGSGCESQGEKYCEDW